jgi:hypothetical protein
MALIMEQDFSKQFQGGSGGIKNTLLYKHLDSFIEKL